MKLIRAQGVGTPLYVTPDEGRNPIAGPFLTAAAARLWIVQDIEAHLSPEQMDVWREISAALPQASDFGLEVGLITMVQRGRTLAQLKKYVPHSTRDRRMLAAGDVA